MPLVTCSATACMQDLQLADADTAQRYIPPDCSLDVVAHLRAMADASSAGADKIQRYIEKAGGTAAEMSICTQAAPDAPHRAELERSFPEAHQFVAAVHILLASAAAVSTRDPYADSAVFQSMRIYAPALQLPPAHDISTASLAPAHGQIAPTAAPAGAPSSFSPRCSNTHDHPAERPAAPAAAEHLDKTGGHASDAVAPPHDVPPLELLVVDIAETTLVRVPEVRVGDRGDDIPSPLDDGSAMALVQGTAWPPTDLCPGRDVGVKRVAAIASAAPASGTAVAITSQPCPAPSADPQVTLGPVLNVPAVAGGSGAHALPGVHVIGACDLTKARDAYAFSADDHDGPRQADVGLALETPGAGGHGPPPGAPALLAPPAVPVADTASGSAGDSADADLDADRMWDPICSDDLDDPVYPDLPDTFDSWLADPMLDHACDAGFGGRGPEGIDASGAADKVHNQMQPQPQHTDSVSDTDTSTPGNDSEPPPRDMLLRDAVYDNLGIDTFGSREDVNLDSDLDDLLLELPLELPEPSFVVPPSTGLPPTAAGGYYHFPLQPEGAGHAGSAAPANPGTAAELMSTRSRRCCGRG